MMGLKAFVVNTTLFINSVIYSFLATIVSILPFSLQFRCRYLYSLWIQNRNSLFGRYMQPLKTPTHDLNGKVAIVTGANSGIGLEIATCLAQQNARVYIACRNELKIQPAINQIVWRAPAARGRVHGIVLDTSDLDSVRRFAEIWSKNESNKTIDILIHNAGIASPPEGQNTTGDGLEIVYATNFLGSFLLSHFLEPYLASDARIILTSSIAQQAGSFRTDFALGPTRDLLEPGFHYAALAHSLTSGPGQDNDKGVRASAKYANSKSMQVIFAKLLQERFDAIAAQEGGLRKGSRKRTVHSFSPGFTRSDLIGKLPTTAFFADPVFTMLLWIKSQATDIDQGAATAVWLATTNETSVVGPTGGGLFWDRMQPLLSSADLLSRDLLDRLWLRWERDAGITWRT